MSKKCVKCGKEAEIILSSDNIIKGLRVEELRFSCIKCAEETGVDVSKVKGFIKVK